MMLALRPRLIAVLLLFSSAAVTAAVRLAKEKEMKDKLIVVILPDSGERYLSSALYDGIGD